MARYSDIRKGAELNDALIKFRAWDAQTADAKRADYVTAKAKPDAAKWPREDGAVIPFNSTNLLLLFECKILSVAGLAGGAPVAATDRARDAAVALSADYNLTSSQAGAVTGASRIRVPNYKLAKIICTDREGVGTPGKLSRITNRPYRQYVTFSASSPIGQKTAGTNFGVAVNAIKGDAEYTAFMSQEGSRISIIPERG